MSKKMVTVSLFIFFAVVVAVLVAGLIFNDRRSPATVTQPAVSNTTPASGQTVLNLAELAKHNSASDCWLLVNGNVYDVTAAINKHPGGAETIIPTCGREATTDFDTKGGEGKPHSPKANNMLSDYYLGQLNATVTLPVK